MSIFISYCSKDEAYAVTLERALSANHYDTWFAPKDIGPGGNFVYEIGRELSPHKAKDPEDRIDEDQRHLKEADYFILLLSQSAMQSRWVRREFLLADRKQIPIMVLHVDHSRLSDDFAAMLIDTQITPAYQMRPSALVVVLDKLQETFPQKERKKNTSIHKKRFTYDQIGIYPIASGDPYFTEGETLRITLGNGQFYLSPPPELLTDPVIREYLTLHHFVKEDTVFGTTLESACAGIPVEGLHELIEESRRKIFQQFLNQENGCYFNNRKYGVSHISRFERTENMAEEPVLRMELYVTDYFTHRVMKDVCKKLAVTHANYIRDLDYGSIQEERILFTSLGINLILCEKGEKILLTSRSTNAAETYKRHSYSLSVIEGVSLSDYDTFNQSVKVQYTVFRGLQEELGVDDSYIRMDTLRFYDLFVNPTNLEMGLSCSLELKKDYSLTQDIVKLHGKDEQLEVSGKKVVEISSLEAFIENNMAGMLPQAVHTLCVYLETMGIFLLDRMHRTLLRNLTSVIAKDGVSSFCGDTYVWSDNYIAVIDGATPKGEMLWDGMKGDVFVAKLIADAITEMDPELSASKAMLHINEVVRQSYNTHAIDFTKLTPAERLQASVLVYSVSRHEVWSFGDCMLRINQRNFINRKEGDQLFAALRAFCIQIERDRRGDDADEQELSAYGREKILPYLKEYVSLANRNVPFGYDVIDGGHIDPNHVKVYAVQKDDCVVMASDGYPMLYDTFEDTEEHLRRLLEEDPYCIGVLRDTKGIVPGDQSFDDRTYVSFRVG